MVYGMLLHYVMPYKDYRSRHSKERCIEESVNALVNRSLIRLGRKHGVFKSLNIYAFLQTFEVFIVSCRKQVNWTINLYCTGSTVQDVYLSIHIGDTGTSSSPRNWISADM